jgi:sortase A
VLGPDDASATKPVAGKNVVSLQTCTLPNYKDRLIVRAELVRILQGQAPRPAPNKPS